MLVQLLAGEMPACLIAQALTQLKQGGLTFRSCNAPECSEGGFADSDAFGSAEFSQSLCDLWSITPLQHSNRCNGHRIAEVLECFAAESQQFAVSECVCPEAEQLQSRETVLLCGILQARCHNVMRHIGPPAGQGLENAEFLLSVLVRSIEQLNKPVPGSRLMTEPSRHHQIRLGSMGDDQLADHRPAPFGKHSEFFAQSSSQLKGQFR